MCLLLIVYYFGVICWCFIGGSTEKGAHIKEWDYYSPSGEFRIDKEGSPTLLNCLMYKMCYYRFGQVYTEGKNDF